MYTLELHTHTHTHTHTLTRIHTHTHAYTCVHVPAHTHTHIHSHTCMHTHSNITGQDKHIISPCVQWQSPESPVLCCVGTSEPRLIACPYVLLTITVGPRNSEETTVPTVTKQGINST